MIRRIFAQISGFRLPTWLVLLAWMYSMWQIIKAGYLQDALAGAKDYMRPIKF